MAISMVPNLAGAGMPKPPMPTQVQAGPLAGQNPAMSQANSLPSASFQAAEMVPKGASSAGPLAEITNNALSNAFTKIDNLVQDMPKDLKSAGQDDVATAKREMSPTNSDISAGENAAGDPTKDSISALNKTFDHAIFMAMVNQVISGVGDTSRTLIRQS